MSTRDFISANDIWGQSKNTLRLADDTGLLLSIFTLTPNIPNICRDKS